MSMKIPAYIKLTEDGADILLSSKKTKINGVVIDRIKMAMPKAGLLRMAQVKYPGSNVEQESYIFCSACTLTQEELDSLDARDYERVQLAYRFLTSELGELEAGPQGGADAPGEQSALPTL